MSAQNTSVGLSGGTSLAEDNSQRKHAEEELRRSHAELQAIYEHVPIMICVLDTSRQVLYANRAFAEFVGKPVAELKGERACGVLGCLRALDDPQGCGHGPHCATCPVRLAMVDTFTTGKSHRGIEYRTTLLCQETPFEMMFLASIAAIQLSGQSSLLLCLEDITERERAQMALRKSENILQARLRLSEYSIAHDFDEVLQKTLDEAEVLTGSTMGFFHFIAVDQKTLLLQAWSTNTLQTQCTAEGKGRHYDVDQAGVWVDCLRQRRPVIHNHYASLPHRKGLPPGHAPVLREVVVPVIRNDLVVAIFGIGNKPHDYDDQDVATLETLANVTWDIVQRKEAEKALRESREQLRLAASAGNVGLWDWDLRTNQVYYSPEWKRQIGYDETEISNRFNEWQSRVHPDDLYSTLKKIHACLAAPQALYRVEFRFRHKDGTYRHILAQASLLLDTEGKPIRMLGSHLDITQHKQTEEALRESEARFRRTFDQAPVGAAMVSLDHRFIMVNEALCRITGYSATELTSRSFGDITHPDDLAADIANARRLEAGEIDRYELDKRYVRRDGSVVWIRLHVRLIRDDRGQPLYYLPMMEDITERKATEVRLCQEMVHVQDLAQTNARLLAQSHEHSEHLRRLATRASEIEENERKRLATELHDRVGPGLTALGLSLSVLRENVLTGQTDSGLSRLDDCRKLVEEIADITRNVMSDLRPPLLDEYGLADALDWLCTRFGKLSKLEIKSDFSKTTNRLEPAKELAFFRITQEALTNVVKHAAARWASVGLRCEDGQVVLEIRDDGVGFDPNELRGRPKPGGLGLLSMRERALAIGAELRVDSVLGKGTRVVVALPE